MKVRELEVGQVVGLARMANGYGPDRSLGICRVTKRNKIRIVLTRESDGYEFSFSARYAYRLLGDGQVDYDTYVESVESQEIREQRLVKRSEIESAWAELERATKRRKMTEVREALAKIKDLEAELDAIRLKGEADPAWA